MEGPSYPHIPELKIKTEGIVKLLTGLGLSNAAGPDEIPSRLLKNLAIELAPAVTSIFFQSHDTGEIPTDWSMAWILDNASLQERHKK